MPVATRLDSSPFARRVLPGAAPAPAPGTSVGSLAYTGPTPDYGPAPTLPDPTSLVKPGNPVPTDVGAGMRRPARGTFQRHGTDPAAAAAAWSSFISADPGTQYDMLQDSAQRRLLGAGYASANGLTGADAMAGFNDLINRTASGARPAGAQWVNPNAYPVGGGNNGAPGPTGGGPTLGQVASGQAQAGGGGDGDVGYGLNVSDYLDPSMRFQMDEAQRMLENSAAAKGMLGSGQTLRDLTSLATNMARTDYGNAFNRATNVRDFTYGVDQTDRLFDYNVQRDDRNFAYGADQADRLFNYQRLSDLAQMGLSGTSSTVSGDNALAGILAGILANRGSIEGAGTIAGSNAVNDLISAMIRQMNGGV